MAAINLTPDTSIYCALRSYTDTIYAAAGGGGCVGTCNSECHHSAGALVPPGAGR